MAAFASVKTLDDLDSLDSVEMIEGYSSAERGDPEPGPNRGRSFWHGWRNRQMDYGLIPIDEDHFKLIGEWLARERQRRANPVSVEGA